MLMVVVVYRVVRPDRLWHMLHDAVGEAAMIMPIIAAAEVFSYMMSSFFTTQSLAMRISELEVRRWILMACIKVFLLVASFFLPPVAVILMTAPTLVPIIESVGFDPIWIAVVLTINMEIGMITPPVGLNLYLLNGIAPDVPLQMILRGALPFMLCMIVGILLLCAFRGIALWLPNAMMGQAF